MARVGKRKWRMPVEAPEMPYDVYEITELDDNFELFIEQCRVMQVVAIDCETNSNLMPDKKKGEMFFDWAQGARAFMATFCASDDTVFATYDKDIARKMIEEADRLGTKKIFQNYKFDAHHFREWAGYTPKWPD